MNNDSRESRPDPIERLIADEEAAAMARFRQGDFRSRLERAVAAEEAPVPTKPNARRIPSWAWTAAALFVAAGILAYVAVPKRGPSGGASEAARAMVLRLPGLDGLDEWARNAALEPAPASPAAGGFAAALAGMKTRARPAGEAAAAERIRPSRLGLEKLMEILIRDRAVEKVLSLASPKFKEG